MAWEKEWNIVEQLLNDGTSKELLKLKKKLAKDITNKLGIKTFQKQIVNYLVNEGSIGDLIWDKVKESLFWEKWLNIITNQLSELRNRISAAHTKEDLEKLRSDIFKETWEKVQKTTESKETTESDNKTTTGTTTQTSSTESSSIQSSDSQNTNNSTRTSAPTQTSSNESSSTKEKAKVNNSNESYEIDNINITVSSESKKIRDSLKWKEKPELEPFACGLKAYESEKAKWHLNNTKYLTVVDFTKNQLKNNRFFVINLDTNTVEYSEKCWHWEGSGGKDFAKQFSDKSWSHQSSLWAWSTADKSKWNFKWTWKWNFPKWFESSNDTPRWIAIHPVKSLVYKSWKTTSQGCFTLAHSQSEVNEILNKIEGWSLVFSYTKSKDYFNQSKYFQKDSNGNYVA